jgi:hypothetical protein
MLSTFDLAEALLQADWEPGKPYPQLPTDATNAVFVLTDATWRPITSFPRTSHIYDFDVAHDDWCIVAEPRCKPGQRNATAFANGKVAARFCIGDGIQHLQCDNDGFWVGYFDEGVFGNFGWGFGLGQPEPVGACGLRRFARNGETALKYPGEFGEIADCYAMNVVADVAWICPYSDFPIISVSTKGERKEWTNTRIRGATALAIGVNKIALIGGYRGEHRRCALVSLERRAARVARSTTLHKLFPRTDLSRFQVLARGANIHLVDQTDWLSVSVDEIA